MRLGCAKPLHQYLDETLRRSSRTSPWLLSSLSPYSTNSPSKKSKLAPLQERKMMDRFRLYAKGGDGGNGCCSSRRSRHDRYGKADGGNGGRGGDVILECSPTVWDFSSLQHHINAKRGGHGSSKNKIGTRGTDKVVQVPVGTVIHLVDGEIPSVIEKSSSSAVLDPWDIPGTLDVCRPDSDEQATSTKPSMEAEKVDTIGGSTSCIKGCAEETASMKRAVQSRHHSFPSNKKSRVSCYELEFGSDCEGVETDDSMKRAVQSRHHSSPSNKKSRVSCYELEFGSDCEGVETDDSMKRAVQSRHQSSPSNKESRVSCYELEFGSNCEGVETDDGMYEAESEEEIDEREEEIEYNVAELTKQGQRVVVACGGDGGLGNLFFPKVPKNIKLKKPGVKSGDTFSPEVSDEDQSSLSAGLPGSQAALILELKSIADIGLVGMPNAGKSTLLGAISRAQPTVGHYAFTTMRPNLGKLNFDDFSVTVADIPGLIKGAHENRGLGHAFLRHIERTKVLAYVVDLAAGLDGRKGIPPWEQLRDLISELEHHLEGLSARPSIVVANKIDEAGAEGVYEELKRRVQGVPIFPVCAILDDGIPELKDGLRTLVNGGESGRLSLDEIKLD